MPMSVFEAISIMIAFCGL
ncbi:MULTISPECIES: putative holin-like toxin [Staphylococcus]